MKEVNQKYLLFLSLLLFLGCTRDADVKIPVQKSALVVHGYIAVGDSFHISLGKTMNINDPVNTASIVKNGWMLVYENDVFADSIKFDEPAGEYVSGWIAKAGKRYKLVAGAPGFENVESTSAAPLPAFTTSVNHILNARSSSGGILLDDIRFSFSDPVAGDNYYITALYSSSALTVCAYTYDPVIEKYTSSPIPFDQGSCINSDQIIFTDKTFNGATREITISAGNEEMKPYTDPSTGKLYKPYIKRYNVTPEHYTYFKNSIASVANSVSTFTNPVSVKGNIKNGYGIFSVFQLTTDSIP
jgi:hypothetical protein